MVSRPAIWWWEAVLPIQPYAVRKSSWNPITSTCLLVDSVAKRDGVISRIHAAVLQWRRRAAVNALNSGLVPSNARTSAGRSPGDGGWYASVRVGPVDSSPDVLVEGGLLGREIGGKRLIGAQQLGWRVLRCFQHVPDWSVKALHVIFAARELAGSRL